MSQSVPALLFVTVCCAAAAADSPRQTHEGIEGCWLRNGAAEAFVSGKPYPRVVAFRLVGGPSPFRVATTDPYYGVRSWFMEPAQSENSGLPSARPADFRDLTPLSVRLVAAPEPKSGLQLTLDVALDAERPSLIIRHGFRNLRDETRRLAAWAIMAVPHEGFGLAAWAKGTTAARSLMLFPGTDPTEPCLRLGKEALGVAFAVPSRGGQLKTGTNTDAGWVGYLWRGQALQSRVAHVARAEYPEGGATVTFYTCGQRRDDGFSEIEHVGPLTDVAPGQTLWLQQVIALAGGVASAGGVDASVAVIRKAFPGSDTR
jgi:hypothetical protein